MNFRIFFLPGFLLFASMGAPAQEITMNYPETRKEEVVDDYHGTPIKDPYRWLEDDQSPETKAWVTSQNEVTRKFLDAIPQREAIRDRLKALWNFERVGQPREFGGRWFFMRNSGLQNQAVLYVTESLDGEPRVLLDMNAIAPDGTVSISRYQPSEDGKWLAYAVSSSGSDWLEIKVRDVATGEDRADHLKWVKFSGISWAKDGSGFYYSRYDAPADGAALTQKNEFQKLYFHTLGTGQETDTLIYQRKDQPQWGINGFVTDDGKYLLIGISHGTDPKNRVFYQELGTSDAPVVELLSEADADYGFVGNQGSVFYFATDLKAPRRRVIAIDTKNPERENWKEILPESRDQLDDVSWVGDRLVCTYMENARSRVEIFSLEGKKLKEPELPGLGTVGGFEGRQSDPEVFYSYTSFTEPGAIYRLNVETGQSLLWRKPMVDFHSDLFDTRQVFFQSKDGTRIPMFLVQKKGTFQDGTNRTLLYGYGGFQISQRPGFSVSRAVWLERGGTLAVVNLRGGGEFGSEWHDAGRLDKKQNVFDDFIAAAEYLIAENITSPANLAIQGGSNGGLLVGACMTQRPELFGAALPAVGVMDMLRFHRFTIGWAWVKEYGSSADPAQFQTLLNYSPYHRLKPGTRYPATLVTTADHDDRVVPAHSFKFAARLQECQAKNGPPVLIRIETSAGHGAGTALAKTIEETADSWAFLEAVLGK